MEKIEARVISADYHLVLKILRDGGMTGNLASMAIAYSIPCAVFLIKHTINKPCLDSPQNSCDSCW